MLSESIISKEFIFDDDDWLKWIEIYEFDNYLDDNFIWKENAEKLLERKFIIKDFYNKLKFKEFSENEKNLIKQNKLDYKLKKNFKNFLLFQNSKKSFNLKYYNDLKLFLKDFFFKNEINILRNLIPYDFFNQELLSLSFNKRNKKLTFKELKKIEKGFRIILGKFGNYTSNERINRLKIIKELLSNLHLIRNTTNFLQKDNKNYFNFMKNWQKQSNENKYRFILSYLGERHESEIMFKKIQMNMQVENSFFDILLKRKLLLLPEIQKDTEIQGLLLLAIYNYMFFKGELNDEELYYVYCLMSFEFYYKKIIIIMKKKSKEIGENIINMSQVYDRMLFFEK